MNNNAILTIIALGVVGIFTIMAVHYHEKKESPVKKFPTVSAKLPKKSVTKLTITQPQNRREV